VALLSSDLVPSLIEMREVIKTIESGEADIVIGTQMVAKGHHFPQLATVGIVDGDLGLGQADPRAGERTFQLMHQVTGRAGRVLTAGRGLVQTYMPEHPVMQAIISGDRETFLAREIRQRQAALLPPFGRLAALIVSARDRDLAQLYARTSPAMRPVRTASRFWAPPRHPWRWCVDGTAGAYWSRRRASSTSRPTCALGSIPCPSRPPTCGLRSISIRIIFFERGRAH
jgi:primosomal protein N' (replication factor Y)